MTCIGNPTLRATALLAAAAFAPFAVPTAAQTADSPWYLGFQVPVMFIDDSESTTKGSQFGQVGYEARATSEYKAGFKFAGMLGYEFGGGFRVEGELFFARAEVDKLSYAGVTVTLGENTIPVPGNVDVPVSGSAKQAGAMANLWFDIPTGTDWTPYIGGGLGLIRVDQAGLKYDPDTLLQETLKNPALAPALSQLPPGAVQALDVPEISTTDTQLAYHFGAGVGYRLNDRTTLQIGYRFQTASDFEFDGRNAQGAIDVKTGLQAHLFEIGARMRF